MFKPKIVHIIPNEKITYDIIDIFDEKTIIGEHIYIIVGGKGAPTNYHQEKESRIIIIGNNLFNAKAAKCLLKSNKIIVHSLLYSPILLLTLAAITFRKKNLSWFIWGADLYSDFNRKSIKSKIRFFIKKLFMRNVEHILTPVKGDFEMACTLYLKEFSYFPVRYMDNSIVNDFSFKKDIQKKNNGIKVLLGNSATRTNNHFEALSILSRFVDEPIEIIVPLSYGDVQYAKEVIKKGEKIFGDKFSPITEFLDRESYNKLLSSINIAIFNYNRQQGIGNINALLYMGAKIFIRTDTTMWNFFNKGDVHGQVYDISTIEKMNFEEFIDIKDEVKVNNRIYIEVVGSREFIVKEWNVFFTEVKKK